MGRKVVIVGGVAGGATAAARLRRLDEQAEIVVLERGPHVSFANCGLPYHIGGEIARRQSLILQTPARLGQRFALDIRVRHEVTAIDRQRRSVRVRDLSNRREYDESYDILLLSPGAEPIRPPLPGADLPQVHTLRNLEDMDRIRKAVDAAAAGDGRPGRALVVGGGFIGLELAENLRRRGLAVTLVELLPQVMPPLDPELAELVHEELMRHGVELHLADAVTALAPAGGRVRATLRSGTRVEADLVVLAVGVRPESGLARAAGLELTPRGAIVVDAHMRTSDPAIYAVGDAVAVQDAVLGGPTVVPLAGPANRQARIAADHICGRPSRYRGMQGTSIVRVFGLAVAMTGASEKVLRQREVACRKVYLWPVQHAGYFPGARPMLLKLLFSPDDGRILGAQIVGPEGVDKRIDVLAVAIQAGLTVRDLQEAELAYAPQYGAAKDPINLAGFVATNALTGDDEFVYPEELDETRRTAWTILDVRDEPEWVAGHIPGAVWIPLPELRARWREVPRDKPIAVVCASGQRSYYACRLLRQKGVPCRNLAGGLRLFRLVHARPAGERPAERPAACG